MQNAVEAWLISYHIPVELVMQVAFHDARWVQSYQLVGGRKLHLPTGMIVPIMKCNLGAVTEYNSLSYSHVISYSY